MHAQYILAMTIIFKNVYLFLREREHMCTGEGQKERETEDPKKPCSVSAEPNVGLELMNNCEPMT